MVSPPSACPQPRTVDVGVSLGDIRSGPLVAQLIQSDPALERPLIAVFEPAEGVGGCYWALTSLRLDVTRNQWSVGLGRAEAEQPLGVALQDLAP